MNGVNKVVHQLATQLHKNGQDVQVVGITKSTGGKGPNRTYPLFLLKDDIKSFKISTDVKNFIASLPMDSIVHFHGVLLPLFTVMARQLRKKGISYVVTPHGALLPRSMAHNFLLKKVYYHLFEKSFLKGAKVLHAITEQEKKALSGFPKVRVIPNGYPYSAEILDRKPSHQIIFGYIGRLASSHKGLDALIDGFEQFYKDTQTGYLWLIGDGGNREQLETMVITAGLQDRVIFHGEKHGPDKLALLNKMDVFVHPSRWDVLPTSILEAAAYRKPLLLTKATGFAEAVLHYGSGQIIQETDSFEISQAMKEFLTLYNDDKLAEIGQSSEMMIKEAYDWHHIAKRISTQLYKLAG